MADQPRLDRSRLSMLRLTLLAGATGAFLFRLWTSFCFFPLTEWNNVRLAPTFMLATGVTPYPGLAGGPLTTWIYGPVPLLVNLPALLGHDMISALYIAGAINLLTALLPAALAVAMLAPPGANPAWIDRYWALLVCLALWPNPSLLYIQADNVAVAFGLVSAVLLVRAEGRHRRLLPLAALCVALAVWSKQTSLGLVVAECLWLGIVFGLARAVRYALLCAVLGLGLGLLFVGWFGFDGLWLNLVRIPGRLPFFDDPWARTLDFWRHLGGYVLLPAIAAVAWRRAIWRRDSPWLLPFLAWLLLLPTAIVSTYKVGGATNSLNGFLYLLPLGSLALVTGLQRHLPRHSRPIVAGLVLGITLQQLAFAPLLPTRPVTAALQEAGQLARQFPGQIYFPWHPLVTFFSDHRFDDAEDGLATRQLAGLAPAPVKAQRHLPPHWCLTAIPGWRDRGFFKQMQPPSAQLGFAGRWTVYIWTRDSKDSSPAAGGGQP